MTLEQVAAGCSPFQYGLPIGQLVRENFPLECDHAFTLSLIGGSFPIMSGCYQSRERDWMDRIARYREIFNDFGVPSAVFFPWSDPAKPVRSETPKVVGSVYQTGTKLLLLAANLGPKTVDARFTLTGDWAKRKLHARNLMENKGVSASNGALVLKAEPFRLLVIGIETSAPGKQP